MDGLNNKVLRCESFCFVSVWSDLMCRTAEISRRCMQEVGGELAWSWEEDIIDRLRSYRSYLRLLHQDIKDFAADCGRRDFPEFPEVIIKKSKRAIKGAEQVLVAPFLDVQECLDAHAQKLINICINAFQDEKEG